LVREYGVEQRIQNIAELVRGSELVRPNAERPLAKVDLLLRRPLRRWEEVVA
jgi:hypothetical protein